MTDGNNISEDAQKLLDDLEAQIQAKDEELKKFEGMHDEDQKMIKKFANEVGPYRKKLDDIEAKLAEKDDTKDDKDDSASKDEGAKTPEQIEAEEKAQAMQAQAKEVDRLQSLITEEDDEALRQMYDSADPSVQSAIDTDPAVNAKFLESYLGDRAVPKKSWRKTETSKDDDSSKSAIDKVEDLFNKNIKAKNYSPISSGASRFIPNGRRPSDEDKKPTMSKAWKTLGLDRGGNQMITTVTQGPVPQV